MYLDDDLWGALHARAQSRHTTVSELVREAVRERYFGKHDQRIAAMQAFAGIRRVDSKAPDAAAVVRSLRRGSRLDRLRAE